MIRHGALAALLILAGPARAQDQEDTAHRADRLQTQALNARSPNGYAQTHATPADQAQYDAARSDYARRLAEWRRRVAACEAGYYNACQQ